MTLALLLWTACRSHPETPTVPGTGLPCDHDADCAQGLVCVQDISSATWLGVDHVCEVPCSRRSDCLDGEVCDTTTPPVRYPVGCS